MRKSTKSWASTIATTLLASLVITFSPGSVTASEFTDVQQGSAMHEAITSLKERNIIDGFTDGTYRPSQNVTRGQAAKLIVHALGLEMPNMKNPKFKDVPQSHRFYKEIASLTNAGYINGYKDGRFGVDDPLTRGQMITILGEAYEFGQAPLETDQFTDIDKNAYYTPYLQPLIDHGVTYGKTETSFMPNDFVNRGQMALFMHRSEQAAKDNDKEDFNPTIENESPSPEFLHLEVEVLALVNVERKNHGLAPLVFDEELAKVARLKSIDMFESNYFDHESPNYGSPFEMMKEFGIDYQSAAENIAWGYPTPESVMTGWINSPGHRKNILNPSYTHIGIGYDKNAHHWTQMFISK